MEGLLIGLFAGCLAGVLIMALAAMSHQSEEREAQMGIRRGQGK